MELGCRIYNWYCISDIGPVMLTSLLDSLNLKRATIWSPGYVFGVDWRDPPDICVETRNNPQLMQECIELNPKTLYVLTVWTHSWSFFH